MQFWQAPPRCGLRLDLKQNHVYLRALCYCGRVYLRNEWSWPVSCWITHIHSHRSKSIKRACYFDNSSVSFCFILVWNGEKEKNIPPCAPPSFGDGLRLRSAAFDVNFCHMPVVLPKILSMALFLSQVSSHLLKLLPSSAKGLHQTQTVRRESEKDRDPEKMRDSLPYFCS